MIPRRRDAASMFTIRNSHRARKRGWSTTSTSAAELSVSANAPARTLAFRWRTSEDDERDAEAAEAQRLREEGNTRPLLEGATTVRLSSTRLDRSLRTRSDIRDGGHLAGTFRSGSRMMRASAPLNGIDPMLRGPRWPIEQHHTHPRYEDSRLARNGRGGLRDCEGHGAGDSKITAWPT